MRLSDGRIVPGNARIGTAEIALRRSLYREPYRAAIGTTIAAMSAQGSVPAVVSLHSFTPMWRGMRGPGKSPCCGIATRDWRSPLIAALSRAGVHCRRQ